MRVTRARFEKLASDALDGLPAWVQEAMENVEVIMEDEPPADQPNLLGLYRGIPLTQRGLGYAGVLPDTITLFRSTIGSQASDEDHLRRVVAHVVAHEVAHHFGISDERLLELKAY